MRKHRPACIHWWVIETEEGPTSPATCRRCGSTRRMRNAYEKDHDEWYRAQQAIPEELVQEGRRVY